MPVMPVNLPPGLFGTLGRGLLGVSDQIQQEQDAKRARDLQMLELAMKTPGFTLGVPPTDKAMIASPAPVTPPSALAPRAFGAQSAVTSDRGIGMEPSGQVTASPLSMTKFPPPPVAGDQAATVTPAPSAAAPDIFQRGYTPKPSLAAPPMPTATDVAPATGYRTMRLGDQQVSFMTPEGVQAQEDAHKTAMRQQLAAEISPIMARARAGDEAAKGELVAYGFTGADLAALFPKNAAKPLPEAAYGGMVAAFDKPDLSGTVPAGQQPPAPTAAQIASNAIAHTGLTHDGEPVDPAMVVDAAQKLKDAQDKKAADAAQRQIQNTDVTTRIENTLANNLTNRFQARAKTTTDNIQSLDQASTILGEAMKGNKAAYGSVIANFVQAADQRAQLRSQMLDYFATHVDPSLAGRWDIVRDKLLKGEWPDSVLQGISRQLDALKQMDMSRYNQLREGEVARHPQLDDWLPHAEEYIGNAGGSAQSSNPYLKAGG